LSYSIHFISIQHDPVLDHLTPARTFSAKQLPVDKESQNVKMGSGSSADSKCGGVSAAFFILQLSGTANPIWHAVKTPNFDHIMFTTKRFRINISKQVNNC